MALANGHFSSHVRKWRVPGPATTLQWTASAGTPVIGMVVNDGGASLTASPLLVTAVSGTTPNYVLTVAGNYYPSISADATMQASLTTLVPGEYIQNSAITNPVKIIGYDWRDRLAWQLHALGQP